MIWHLIFVTLLVAWCGIITWQMKKLEHRLLLLIGPQPALERMGIQIKESLIASSLLSISLAAEIPVFSYKMRTVIYIYMFTHTMAKQELPFTYQLNQNPLRGRFVCICKYFEKNSKSYILLSSQLKATSG